MYLRILPVLVSVFLIAGSLRAQNISKTNVIKMNLRSSGAIQSGNQVKGYYFFYNLEKKDNKLNNYQLSVFDENLREINSANIVRPKTYVLVDAIYNESIFAFLFYDTKAKSTEIIGYDSELKQIGSRLTVVKNRFAQMTYASLATSEAAQSVLVPVENKGFLSYGMAAGSGQRYEIKYFDNTLKEVWVKISEKSPEPFVMASEGFQSGDYVGSLIMTKARAMSKDIDTELLVQRISDGSVVFQAPLESGDHSFSLSDVAFDQTKNTFVVFGEYFNKKDKELKAQSLGFIHVSFDMKGKIVDQKINSWATEISKVTPVNEKGKFEGLNANILVHDIIRANDGQIFVVGEQYKKAASGAGIALTVLATAAGGQSNVATSQLNVYNIVIFQFNPDYSINKVHVFEKDKNEVLLPAGATYMSSKMLSYYAKAVGGFDFIFSQVSPDQSMFSVAYINYDRAQTSKSKNILGMVVYTPEKTFSVDKMPMPRKSTDYYVYRAKDGYVLITEYFKKEKRFESRLEKINF